MYPLIEDMSKYMPVLCQEYMLFFCLPFSSRPRLNLLSTQQQGRTWVQNMFRNLVPYFLTCPQLVGTWVKHIFRNLVPDFWRVMVFLASHVLNVACHGMSISIVSISSVSCRVRILRVSVSMPCRGHLGRVVLHSSQFIMQVWC